MIISIILMHIAFVGFCASLIVTTTTNDIVICLEHFHPSSPLHTHLSRTFSCKFIVLVSSFSLFILVVFSSLASLVQFICIYNW
jgi:hypothetical protein